MIPTVLLVGVAAVTFLAVEIGPLYLNDRFRDLREPTDPERAALDALRGTAVLDVDRVAVIETVGATSIDVAVRGPPGRRVLFVTDSVLDDLDEDVAVGLLAAEGGRVGTYYGEFRAVAVAAVVGVLAAIIATVVPFEAGFAALIVVGVASFWVGRRVQYAADERAADAVGADRVADAFERVATVRGIDPETGGWSTWFEVQPPLGDRIVALRRRGDEE